MKLCKKCLMLYSRMNFVSLCPLSSWLKGAAEFFLLCKFSRVVQIYEIKSWNLSNCSYAVWYLSGGAGVCLQSQSEICGWVFVIMLNCYWEYIQHVGKCVRCTSSYSQRSSHINNITNIRKWGKTLVSQLTSIYQRAIIIFHQFMTLSLNSAKKLLKS